MRAKVADVNRAVVPEIGVSGPIDDYLSRAGRHCQGYSGAAFPGAGKTLPYLFTRSIQIAPFTVIAKGARSKAQSEKPWTTVVARATTRRTNPPPSIALAQTIGLRVMAGEYPF